jgi:hypothetical protein
MADFELGIVFIPKYEAYSESKYRLLIQGV